MIDFAPLVLAIAFNTADKVIARRTLRGNGNPDSYLLIYQLVCFFVSVLPAAFSFVNTTIVNEVNQTSAVTLALLVPATMLAWSIFGVSTFRSTTNLELSISSTISRSKLLWTALLGMALFGEKLSFLHIFGLVIIFLANVSLRKLPSQLLNSKGIAYALCAAISLSVAIALDKWLLDYFTASMVLCIGFAGSTITSVALNWKTRLAEVRDILWSSVIAASAGSAGYYFLLISMQQGDLSVVVPVYQSAHIVFVVAGIVFLKEYSGVAAKLISALISTFGIILIFVGR